MASRIREFPVAREFPEPREIPVTREFPRLKLFPPVSRETGISREFPARGFPMNIADLPLTETVIDETRLTKLPFRGTTAGLARPRPSYKPR